jgi:hypothetical protein
MPPGERRFRPGGFGAHTVSALSRAPVLRGCRTLCLQCVASPSVRLEVFCLADVPESTSWQGIRIHDPFGPRCDASQRGADSSLVFGTSEELFASDECSEAARMVRATIGLRKATITACIFESPETARRFPIGIVVDFWRLCSGDHRLVSWLPSKFQNFVPILSKSARYLRPSPGRVPAAAS